MEIRQVEYSDVYGSLSNKLNFFQGENFLVGINGCGKTTVLNLIRWVLGPNLPELCALQHGIIKVEIKHGKYLYSVQSQISKGKHQLKVVTKDKSRDFKPITTVLLIDPQHIPDDLDIQEQYRRFAPETHELNTWKFLAEELPSPVFIGLGRKIESGSSEQSPSNRQKRPRPTERVAQSTATTLMRDAFNTGRRQLVEINDELNREVLELSFSGVLKGKLQSPSESSKETSKKIKQLKLRFEDTSKQNTYSKALSSEKVRTAIVKYLDSLSSIIGGNSKKDNIGVILNQHNFERASKMFDLFENHETKAKQAQLEIDNFSKAVNTFIADSGKSIHFDEDTGTPYFVSHAFSCNLKLSDLSSGEAQIIVLLSYFAFIAKKGIPIIIDEPELSLHVQWQKNFVDAVKKVMPEECQTIMATHSPEICGADEVNVQPISVRGSK